MAKNIIFDKKNILIVGGAGFIGSHLCDELIADNKIICLDNFLTGDDANISHLLQNPNFRLIKHDITQSINLEDLIDLRDFRLEFQGLQEIYFLASPGSPVASQKFPLETLLVNSLGLKNALDLAVKYKANFIFASSPAVYGDSDATLVKEDFEGVVNHLGPKGSLAEAQRFGEILVKKYREKHNIDAKIVRVFNSYGSRMKLDDGRMIPEMIKSALANEVIKIFGDEKSAGTYLHISDLLKALVKVMSSNLSDPLNLGSEWLLTYTEIANQIIALTGSKSTISYQAPASTMSKQQIPDISAAKEALEWFPICLIDKGLEETIEYSKAQVGILEPR